MTHSENTYKLFSRQLGQYIAGHGMRSSMERQVVLQIFCTDKKRWTIGELIEEAEKKHICRATVYNALKVLTDAQIIRMNRTGTVRQAVEYELNETGQNRIRMICTKCQRQIDLKDTGITRLVNEKKYNNFIMQRFELTILGECKVCRKKRIAK